MPFNCLELCMVLTRYKLTSQSNPIWLVAPPPVTCYCSHCVDKETEAQGCYRNCPKSLASQMVGHAFWNLTR